MNWFKRKKRPPKLPCFHSYRVVDFGYWDDPLTYSGGQYEIGCIRCGITRIVDEDTFESLKQRNLVKEATE